MLFWAAVVVGGIFFKLTIGVGLVLCVIGFFGVLNAIEKSIRASFNRRKELKAQ
jgi:hypothetical protein